MLLKDFALRYEIMIAVDMKVTVLWYVTMYSLVEEY